MGCNHLGGSVCERLFKLQKRSVRLISNAKYNVHTDPLFKYLSLLKSSDIYLVQHYKFIYKVENQMLPMYFMSSLFVRNSEVHYYDTRHARDFRLPVSRHAFVKNSIRFCIPYIYNNIPLCIKEKNRYTQSSWLPGFTKATKFVFMMPPHLLKLFLL